MPVDSNLDDHGWELESAEERHANSPTFEIPELAERSSLQVGQMVQLLFLFPAKEDGLFLIDDDGEPIVQCERMWVTIQHVDRGRYHGQLESLPCSSDVISPGDIIAFGPEHVSCVLIPLTDPRHPDWTL